LGNKKDLFVMR